MNLPSARPPRLRSLFGASLWIAALAASFLTGFGQATVDSHALVGPFVSNGQGWTLVPGGDFESGPTNLPVNLTYGPLAGDMELFVSAGASGTAQRSSLAAFNGNGGVDLKPGRFKGPGIALTYYKTLTFPPGQSVVLSAFVKRLNPTGSKASVSLDFWGAPGTSPVPVPATTSEWQFVYGIFSVPTLGGPITLGARVNIDGDVTPEDEIYVDDLSLTPLAEFVPPRRGGVLVGPFARNVGFWTNVPGGNFETGPYVLPVNTQYAPLIGDMELFQSAGSSGAAFRSNSAAYSGAKGVDLRAGTFNGSGMAVTYYGLYPVKPGASVVLSAFVRRVNPATSNCEVFVDFWDVPGTSRVVARTNVAGWQFLYSVFTAPTNGGVVNVGARLGVDGNVTPEDHIYADELSITPLEQFVPPQPANTDFTLGAEGSAVLANGFVVGIQLTSGGFGYTNVPSVLILGGGGSGATAVATVSGGIVTGIKMTSAGIGYTSQPIVQIEPPRPATPVPAKATAVVTGGFVTDVVVNAFGSGYSKVPKVQLIGGGGSGAAATAVIANGIVVGVVITNAGAGYTSAPRVIIDPPVFVATPPFSVAVEVNTVAVIQSVTVGRIYVLESSRDLNLWTPVGEPFEATSDSITQVFEVGGRPTLFRLRDVTYGP